MTGQTTSVSLRRRPQQGAARGQVLPLVVLGLVPLLGLSALAIDLGFWRYQQRLQQAAADSAAIAGATELQYSTVAANVSAAAVKDATTNGYTADGSSVFVTVNNPPASGNYSTKSDAVEVIVRKVQPKYFAGIFGSVSSSESVRAVAELTSNMSDCVLALIPAASPYTMFTTGGSLRASAWLARSLPPAEPIRKRRPHPRWQRPIHAEALRVVRTSRAIRQY